MSVYLCIPSARPNAEECLSQWRAAGYKLAIFREERRGRVDAEVLISGIPYPGYPNAVNLLVREVLRKDSEAEWLVAAGDDTSPDPRNPEEIGRECSEHFSGTFGVMQPTGDPWSDSLGRIIERIAGSPWMGREWCRRANGGRGPLWPEYVHIFADEELQNVAMRLGVFWQRPDLIHYHGNFTRNLPKHVSVMSAVPEFLRDAYSPAHWWKYSTLFTSRKEAGFPGSDPID
jgi:hypothetical protein